MPQKETPAEVIASYAGYRISSYCSLAARVLFLWDYCVTFGDEVHYVWYRKFTAATFLFLVNRYVNLLITILEIFEESPIQTAKSCRPFSRFLMTLLILALFIVATFAALRVYAIWNRNWQLALPVLLLGLVSPALNIVLDVAEAPVLAPPPSSGCGISLSISESLYSTLIICNRATTSAYDGIVLVLTLARTYRMKQRASRLHLNSRLIDLLMSDGTMYFALLLVINIAQIIITSRVSGSNYLSYFVSPFTSMLISRFLLDLRKVPSGESPMNPSASTMFVERPDLTTIVFEETGLSTFGAPLGSGSESVDFDGSENSDTEGISAEDSVRKVTPEV